MEKDNSTLLNFIRTILMVIVMLVIFVGITNHNKKETKKEEPKTKEEVKQFRKSELILWNNFLKKAKEKKYIIEDNLESIELIEIVDYGRYLKKSPNLRYEQINFTYKCKSNTTCITDKFPKLKEDSEIRVATTIIDLTNKEYLEMTGYSFRKDSEFVTVTEPFIYEGEES